MWQTWMTPADSNIQRLLCLDKMNFAMLDILCFQKVICTRSFQCQRCTSTYQGQRTLERLVDRCICVFNLVHKIVEAKFARLDTC